MAWRAEINETALKAAYKSENRPIINPNSLANLQSRERSQDISNKGRRKIRKAVTALTEAVLEISKREREEIKKNNIELTFCTLTLPAKQSHTDQEIKRKAFNSFLQYFRKYYNQNEIIWRAEAQKNGNIHFHIIFTCRVPHQVIRNIWNRAMKRMGYIDKYTKRMMKLSLSEYIRERKPKDKKAVYKAVEAYKKGVSEGWQNPNSTDIHSLKKIKNVGAYISKYVSKKSKGDTRLIQGKVYGISRGIASMDMVLLDNSEEVIQIITDCIEMGVGEVYADEYYCVIYLKDTKFSNYSEKLKNLLYTNHKANLQKLINPPPKHQPIITPINITQSQLHQLSIFTHQ